MHVHAVPGDVPDYVPTLPPPPQPAFDVAQILQLTGAGNGQGQVQASGGAQGHVQGRAVPVGLAGGVAMAGSGSTVAGQSSGSAKGAGRPTPRVGNPFRKPNP